MENLIDLRLNFDKEEEGGVNLKELAMESYRGNAVFPSWIISLTNLKSSALIDGKNCEQLPLFGKLLSLEKH